MIVIRQMEKKDLNQVSEIEKSIFSLPWSMNSFMEVLQKENTIYLVAEDGDQIVGYCGLWNILSEGEITNVAVREEYRKRRIGYNLLKELLKQGKDRGIEAFTLEVRESNGGAIHLYESFGFEVAGIRKGFYERPKEDALIMWKKSSSF